MGRRGAEQEPGKSQVCTLQVSFSQDSVSTRNCLGILRNLLIFLTSLSFSVDKEPLGVLQAV